MYGKTGKEKEAKNTVGDVQYQLLQLGSRAQIFPDRKVI